MTSSDRFPVPVRSAVTGPLNVCVCFFCARNVKSHFSLLINFFLITIIEFVMELRESFLPG